jgi:hypothetical protein
VPKDDRQIIFDYAETYKAIFTFCIQKSMQKLPPGVITSISTDPANAEKIKVKIENPQMNTVAEFEYSQDFLAAALILYCKSLLIPIARKSQKHVETRPDSVVLHLSMVVQ